MSELKTNCNKNCEYYSNYKCFKPDGVFCPSQSVTYDVYNVSYLAKRCAICGNNMEFIKKSDEIICNECKEAIKKLKEWLQDDK